MSACRVATLLHLCDAFEQVVVICALSARGGEEPGREGGGVQGVMRQMVRVQ